MSASDLIVIGGGIQGLTLALVAAERGLRPRLLERGAFGAGGSVGAFGALDGGFQHLRRLKLGRLRRSKRGQAWFRKQFPDAVKPLACLMPLDGRGLRRPLAFDLLLSAERTLLRGRPSAEEGRVLSPGRAASFCPWLRTERLVGAVCWYESTAPDVAQLVRRLVERARAAGAILHEGVEAEALRLDGETVTGVLARDHKRFARLAFQAPLVVNCAGGEAAALARRLDAKAPMLFEPRLAFSILLDRTPPFAGAIVMRGPDHPLVMRPFKGRLLAGPGYAPAVDGAAGPTHAQVDALHAELAQAAPGLSLRDVRIAQVFGAVAPGGGAADDPARDVLYDHAAHGGPRGLIAAVSAESAAAPELAAEALALAMPARRRLRDMLPLVAERLYERILPGGAR